MNFKTLMILLSMVFCLTANNCCVSSDSNAISKGLKTMEKEIPLPYHRDLVKSVEKYKKEELPEDALLVPMIDARRMEVYSAVYDRALKEIRPIQADIVTAETYKEYLDRGPVYFFGNGAMKCQTVIQHPNAHFIDGIHPLAKNMFPLAERSMHLKEFQDVAYFEPYYLKEFVAIKSKPLL